MNRLDAFSSEYLPTSPTACENDLIMHWYPHRIIERMGPCRSLLELGLGHGVSAKLFNGKADRHVIVEGSPLVVAEFRKRHPDFNAELVLDFFESFEPNLQFEVIVMGFMLEHVDNPGALLAKYKHYLSPKGRLFVTVPNAKSLNRRIGLELGKIDDIYSLNSNDIALGHQRQYCCKSLRDELSSQGYRVVHEEGIYLKPLPLNILQALPDFEANLQAMLRVGVEFPELCVGLLMEAQLA